ncbi:MAG TPA: SRPBCC family protein [Candidatus Agrococcus pullicola]|uniref:SRPBCC family protein n=1 Tax=Candidatus Agrococcus pullicola TaxID=2838429 RepID=A0A9D2C8H4_9MICO|nr:SRPBCC family protein [Candidatus Agrococcus pullicola]
MGEHRLVSASTVIAATAETLFEWIADPALQPAWDGNENLLAAEEGQRVRAVGNVFTMTLTMGQARDNHVVEFEEGRRIAWLPAPEGAEPLGHLWRWELDPTDGGTLVTHTYDWTELQDETRLWRARATTETSLRASIDRLAGVVGA